MDPLALPRARLRRGRLTREMVGFLLALSAVTIVVTAVRVGSLAIGLLLLAVLGLPLAALTLVQRRMVEGGEGVEADARGLSVGGRLVLPRAQLRRAVVVAEGGTVMVVLTRPLGLTEIVEGLSETEAHALVHALGLDAAAATSEFAFDAPPMESLPPLFFWLYLLLPVSFFGLLVAPAPGWLALVLPPLWYAGLLVAAVPKRLVVGLDGVMVRWLGRRRLIPYDAVASLEHDGQRIRLGLRDGSAVVLSAYWIGQPWERGRWKHLSGFGSRRAYVETVAARLAEARAASQTRAAPGASAWLARGQREPRAWLSELRGLLARDDFRRDAPGHDDLWATLEDQRQPAATRAAAAVALSPSLDPPGRERLRLAASTVVDPSLRRALEAGQGDDDEALLAALDGLDPGRRRQG